MAEKTGGKTQLSPNTSEFAYLEYGLQLALHAGTARIVAAYVLSNPHLTLQFEKRSKNILTLPSWVDATHLSGANTEEDVIRRGFQFTPPQTGMKFSVGSIRLPQSTANSSPTRTKDGKPQRNIRKVLMCKLTIGRAQVVDEGEVEACVLPEGYDSFYLKDTSVGRDGKASVEDYHHEYFIKGSNQILPMYLVHYDFDPVKERKSREKPKCENCEDDPATVFCSADAANLCNKCDGQLHLSKLASRHVRTPIGKGSDVFGHCRHHPDKQIEFFCSQCHIPVCVFCKMVGNHANGEAAKHQLVSVSEAYSTVIHEAQAHDPILQTRRTEINNHIAAVNSRAKAVEKMGAQLESQLEDMYRKASTDLREIIRMKLNTLHGDELELHRQLTEIDRLESFLRYQQQGDATLFLFNWARHQQYRAELHDFGHFRDVIDVQLDARITGSINVVVDADAPMQQQHAALQNGNGGSGGVTSPGKKGKVQNGATGHHLHHHGPAGGLDFFAETLGTFDEMSITQQEATEDGYSETSGYPEDD
ncbi:hypothetical protein HDV00_012824 [Rhizophlyctis rosea]|nr:hypothetical protein HDV00_012824 [Rhizophlyctis rosea]